MTGSRPTPQEWNVAVGTGLLRLGAGVALLRGRRRLPALAGAAPDDKAMQRLFTYFGIRDTAVGVSALLATRPGSSVPQQLVVQGVADTTDAALLGVAMARGHVPRLRGTAVVALAAVTALGEYAGALALGRRSTPPGG
ncbi:MAG: hypothetical protein JO222_00265 [Frankiales bacterium]|nr:hypothetical protein [Frankiales bacterium]